MKAPNSNRRVAHLFGFCKGAHKFSRHILFCSTGLNCADAEPSQAYYGAEQLRQLCVRRGGSGEDQ